jgi:hypothetical protein
MYRYQLDNHPSDNPSGSVVDTDPDPAFQVNPDTEPDPDPVRIQGFDDQKLKKKIQLKFFYIFFCSKIAIYLSLGLLKGRPSYMRSLQPLKENIQEIY